jgi:SAM-dependent methyltransferase
VRLLAPRSLTPVDRAQLYNDAFPDYPPLVTHGRWLYGNWTMGQDYRGSGFYGAYPPSYLKRIRALFPEMDTANVMHLFSGSLQQNKVRGVLVDIKMDDGRDPSVVADARLLPFAPDTFDLVIADTPYSAAHAVRYGTSMPSRAQVFRSVAEVVKPGGHIVWIDTKHPMHSKTQWRWWGAIHVIRSTNHDYRGVTMFERV